MTIGRDINTGQNNFAISVGHKFAHLTNDLAHRHTAGIPTAKRDDAKRTTMITTVLDLHKGACTAFKPGNKVTCGFLDRHDVVNDNTFVVGHQECFGLHLGIVAKDAVNFAHLGEFVRVDLNRTAGHENLGVRVFTPQAANALSRLTFCLGRDRTCIDNDRIIKSRVFGMVAHHLGFIGVQTTSKCNDAWLFDARHFAINLRFGKYSTMSLTEGQVRSARQGQSPCRALVTYAFALFNASLRRSWHTCTRRAKQRPLGTFTVERCLTRQQSDGCDHLFLRGTAHCLHDQSVLPRLHGQHIPPHRLKPSCGHMRPRNSLP